MAFRTQKISQMTPKGADLEATDLIEVSTLESGSYVTRSITGQELIDAIPAPTGFVPTSRTLTINGVAQDLSADRSWTIATGLTVGTTPISSGTIGRVLFEGTGNVLQQSSSLFWDSTNNRLGIGTASPSVALDLNANYTFNTGIGRILNIKANSGPTVIAGFGTGMNFALKIGSGVVEDVAYIDVINTQTFKSGDISFKVSQGSSPTEAMRINYLGNILIGTTINAGFRLDVNGTARVVGQNYYGTFSESPLLYSSTTAALYDSSGASLTFGLRNGGGGSGRFIFTSPAKSATSLSTQYLTQLTATFNPTSGVSLYTMLELTPTINQTGGANGITRGLFIDPTLTAAADFRAIETTRGNVLLGTTSGNVGIGTTTPVSRLSVVDSTSTTASLTANALSHFNISRGTSGVTNLVFTISGVAPNTASIQHRHSNIDGIAYPIAINPLGGNVQIGTTTDAGFKLDVNGTARVSGNLTLGANNPQLIWTTGAFQLFYSTTRLMRVDFEGNYQLQKSLIVAPSSSTAINASAVMQADSTTQGFLPPRMTTTQKNAIASPATGLQVYDTTLNQMSYYNGTTWTNI